VALLAVPLVVCSTAFAGTTASWVTTLRLSKDATLDVTEEIQQDFGKTNRHGIFRIIPVDYPTTSGAKMHTQLLVKDVKDEFGNLLPYTARTTGDDVKIQIGDPDKTVTGKHVYVIHYIVRRAVNFFDHQPEVYWNAVGTEWPFPIGKAQVLLYLPAGVDFQKVDLRAFKGPPGATNKAEAYKAADGVAARAENLAPGEGLTLVTRLPQEAIVEPTFWQELLWFVTDWLPAFLIPAFVGGCMWLLWWSGGRDQDGGKPIAVEWNPPTQLSPAEVGTLVDEHCDMQDVISILIDLAARGYIKIKEIKTTQLLFFSNKDYEFTKLAAPSAQPLSEYERKFLIGVFGTSPDGACVRLSDLKEHFYVQLPAIKKAIYASLMNKHMFQQSPDEVRTTWIILATITFFASIPTMELGHIPAGIGLLISGIIIGALAGAMPAKTAAGSKAARESLGFARFVKLAEKDRIRVLAKDDPTMFGRLLPYALVLGAADQWAEAFKEIMTRPPDWYEPYGCYDSNYSFSSTSFVHDLGGGLHTMQQTFSATPAASGGSGFSDGGGFSGGGFGGGGGGEW